MQLITQISELQLCPQVLANPIDYSESDVEHCKSFQQELEHPARGKRANLSCQLKLPLIQKGCEGELCGCRTGSKVIQNAVLLREPRMGAPQIGAIKKGEMAAEFDLWIRIEELGEATFSTASIQSHRLGLNPGDRIPVLKYGGEGVWIVCLDGHEESLGGEDEADAIKILREPKRTHWIRIKTQQGVVGYALEGTLERVNCG
jgi:hypothetical protein